MDRWVALNDLQIMDVDLRSRATKVENRWKLYIKRNNRSLDNFQHTRSFRHFETERSRAQVYEFPLLRLRRRFRFRWLTTYLWGPL
ncbi:hypothetical protein K443DRAFT_445319 [Laccaria amethystina LaAM-08-1]|uniref:Uncharacterized protein n=1 Tax=Laccaria amethystina LaAM-08-1 TaxID=1095629 RepID=A0A0C9X393_9AGAR|nr:hypothetical protein K443DRAFT_445319 [Laccaria amethystina LaAM-08-1]